MAEVIIIPVVASVVLKLAPSVLKEIKLIYCAEEEFDKLKNTFSALQAVLPDAEQKADQSPPIKDWVEKLKDAAYDADDLLGELSYETLRREVMRDKIAKKVRIFFSKHNQLAFAAKMVHRIKKLNKRLDNIATDRNRFNFSEAIHDRSNFRTKDRESTHSFVLEKEVIGRDEEKEEIVKRLLKMSEKDNVSVDAIVGIGGLGKTMLANSVFNHKMVEDAFDLRLWVCISDIFDLKIIVEKIIEEATKKKPYDLKMNSLQSELRKEIDGKKYLLVMDDLWNEDGERWADLKRLLMGGAKGSKILITTRSELVAKVSKATSPYILNGFSESNSWILFKQMAFENCEEPESLNKIEIGKEIVRKCKGVPLVIKVIGRLLWFKKSEAEWLSFKKNELSTITQRENEITQVLKLSYNHLPSHLKPCFGYCSLFPKDYKFKKDELIKLWVAEGFVQSQGGNECLEDVGNEYFMQLIWRSIFQDIERNEYDDVVGCKMHDLMHDLARLVAGSECYTSDSNIKNVNERTRRVSLNCGGELKLSALSSSQLNPYKLRTFLWSQLYEFKTDIEALISSLNLVRVLDLRQLEMRKVPGSIAMLKHLRFLDLSKNKKIKSIPSSVTKLHNLQTLNISHLSLKKLPKDIGSLDNLRHLDISENVSIEKLPNSIGKLQKLLLLDMSGCESLKELPRDISNLVNLKHLYLRGCHGLRGMPLGLNMLTGLQTMNLYAVSSGDSGLWQLNTLVNIRGELRIRGLHHLRNDPSQANTVNLNNNQGVRHLIFKWEEIGYNPNDIDHDFVVLEKLHPNKNVERLTIMGYGGVRLSSWVSSLSNLTKITIEYCERLQYVPRLDQLPNLRSLLLSNLNLIEYMDNNETVDDLHSSVFFPSLQSLFLMNMDKLKGWWKPRELFTPKDQFTPKDPGESFLLQSFHCLSKLEIRDCPQMFSIPFINPSLKTLRLTGLSVSLDDYTHLFQHLTALRDLHISLCKDLVMLSDGIGNLTSLEILEIVGCSKLTLLPDAIGQLSSLNSLIIENCPKLTLLPDAIGQLSSLNRLRIKGCDGLTLLPDAISQLSSLRSLTICDCPKLTLLPNAIGQLSSLRSLTIFGCKRLEKRCKPQIGEDWSKIAHVKDIYIGVFKIK